MITAVDCTIVRTATKTNSKYLLQFLSSQSYFDEVNTCLVGGTRQRISRSNLAAFDVPIPAKYEEQKAIGEFLCGIDNLITLHQRKLDEMKNRKSPDAASADGDCEGKAMNQKEIQEHLTKEALKRIVDNSPNCTEQIKQDLKNIIDAGNTPEEILQATLLYFAALHLS